VTATLDDDLDSGPSRQPCDLDAERSVLGAAITFPDTFLDEAVPAGLTAADFYLPAHADTWEAITRLSADGVPYDMVAVQDELRTAYRGRAQLGGTFVFDLAAWAATPGSVAYHARIVRKHAAKRRGIAAGQRIIHVSLSPETDAADVQAEAEAAVATIDAPTDDTTWSVLDDVMADVRDRYRETADGDGPQGVRWGFVDVDKAMPPIVPGDFAVIVAWSGGGKSVVASNIALHAAVDQGHPVLLHSLEMTRVEVGQRYAAKTGSINLNKIIHGQLDYVEEGHLERAIDKMNAAPLIVDEIETLTLSRLRASIRRHRPRPYFVVVDQIPIMVAEDSRVSREQQLTTIAYGLKRMAKSEGVGILACAQLNSAPMSRSNKKPTLEDIRECRAIGHAANSVVALYDPTEGEQESSRAGEYEWMILKNRQGPRDTLILAQQFHYSRLVDMAPESPASHR
jgi:replicative DNA helicase